MRTIDERIEQKKGDVIYWQRRVDQSNTAYTRRELQSAKYRLSALEWEKEYNERNKPANEKH